jgi:sulfur carrier protein ThiS
MNKINLTVVAIVATLGVLTAASAAMNNGAILPRAQASTRRIVYINRQLSLQIV